MAVEAYKSAQIASNGVSLKASFEDYAKLRYSFFSLTPGVIGDANSTCDLVILPPGRVRVLPFLSRIATGAFGASRVLDIGHRAYTKEGGAIEAEALNAFVNDLDVSSAVALTAWSSTVLKYDMFSRSGIVISALVAGGTWQLAGTLNGCIAYLVE
jgi:hypothetical protein